MPLDIWMRLTVFALVFLVMSLWERLRDAGRSRISGTGGGPAIWGSFSPAPSFFRLLILPVTHAGGASPINARQNPETGNR